MLLKRRLDHVFMGHRYIQISKFDEFSTIRLLIDY